MVELKVLTPNDWQLWRELRLAALEESPGAFGSTLAGWQGDGDREERWRQRLIDVAFNVVAYVDDNPAGMVSGAWNEQDVELLSLWVAPCARGTGVGDFLVETVTAWAREQQAPGIGLYHRLGFHVVGPSPESEPGSAETLFVRSV